MLLLMIGEGMQRIVKNTRMDNLFFVMPGQGSNVHKSAKRLIGMSKIREVLITEGACGFVVRTVPSTEREDLSKEISRIVGGRSMVAVCHYQYRK